MGVFNKAKLAAKREALKGLTKPVRDLSLESLPATSKPISAIEVSAVESRTRYDQTLSSSSKVVRIIPIKARVVGSQDLTNAILERRAVRLAQRRAKSHASKLNPEDYGSMKQLRDLLGLPPLYSSHNVDSTNALPQDALLVSFDTEWERRGLGKHVVEIGVTLLDTRDISKTAPGPYARDWISKSKTYHYVVDLTRRPTDRMRGCYFSDDMFADLSTIKQDLLSILQQSTHPKFNPATPEKDRPRGTRKVILVGHSVAIDLHQMYRSPDLHLDFFSKDVFLTKPSMAFDTLMLTDAAIQQGAEMTSAKLGKLVNWLGVHPQYRYNDSLIGCHNAGNDAAYTMMALLMYAVRWEEIVPGKTLPSGAEPQQQTPGRGLRMVRQRSACKIDQAVISGNRVAHKARLFSNELSPLTKESQLFTPITMNKGFRSWFAMMASWARRH